MRHRRSPPALSTSERETTEGAETRSLPESPTVEDPPLSTEADPLDPRLVPLPPDPISLGADPTTVPTESAETTPADSTLLGVQTRQNQYPAPALPSRRRQQRAKKSKSLPPTPTTSRTLVAKALPCLLYTSPSPRD